MGVVSVERCREYSARTLAPRVGFVGTDSGVFFVVTGIGGLSLAGMRVDLAAFHGKYTRGNHLPRNGA